MVYSRKDIFAKITLYNSLPEVIENISTYKSQVNRLYVIDNSNIINSEQVNYFHSILSIEYITNFGIVNALNKAVHLIIHEILADLLTIDDGRLSADVIKAMLSFYRNVGMLSTIECSFRSLQGVQEISIL